MFPKDTRFLIVDDFPTMRKIIKKVLLELGFTDVLEADDGATALPALTAAAEAGKPYGFIISDWSMPKMQGMELLRHCKADTRLKEIPFVLVTAESDQEHIVEAAMAGVSDYIVKPFNAVTLKMKLERVWQKHRSKNPEKIKKSA